jgi:hypothetical protein
MMIQLEKSLQILEALRASKRLKIPAMRTMQRLYSHINPLSADYPKADWGEA